MIEILKPEYGGPENPEFDETLHHDHEEKATEEATPKVPSEVSPGPLPLPKPGHPIVHPDDPKLEFDASARSRREKDKLVWADVARLDEAWSKDASFYVGPGGSGENPTKGKYDEAARFVEKARAEGLPIEMGEIHVGDDGNVTFTDGRHRFAVLRDRGLTRLPIAASKDSAKRAAKLYGTGDGERETN